MRHLKRGRKLNRSPSHRLALMRNIVASLLRHERIQTTDPKAKELRSWADRVIDLGKEASLHARRQAVGMIQDEAVVRKVFDTLAPRFKDRPGGYTRIVKAGWRRGDGAPLSVVELVPGDGIGKAQAPSEAGKKRRAAKKGEAAGKKPRRRQPDKTQSA